MQQKHKHLRRPITWYGPWHVGFFFFGGNDIISDVNLKYTFYKFTSLLSCVWITYLSKKNQIFISWFSMLIMHLNFYRARIWTFCVGARLINKDRSWFIHNGYICLFLSWFMGTLFGGTSMCRSIVLKWSSVLWPKYANMSMIKEFECRSKLWLTSRIPLLTLILIWWSLKLIKLVLLATTGWLFYILVQDNELYSRHSD